jgi:hypothetical protein
MKAIIEETAIDWLISRLYDVRLLTPYQREIIKYAKEREKEQIKEAWYNGGVNGMGLFETNTGEEYYNQTYNQNK